jgi:hypothetical protein
VREDDPVSAAEVVPADRPDAWELRLDGMGQSHVDLADPTRLVFDYVRRIGDVLDVLAPPGEPLRVVHVGGGALTLPRYVAATRPRSSQIVLEPDAGLVALVRAELPLPPRSGIRVRELPGREGVAGLREAGADVVVLDAFAGGRVPGDLVTVTAFELVRRALVPGGVLVANLVDRAPFAHTRRVVAALREAWADEAGLAVGAEQSVLRGRRQGNLVLTAGRPTGLVAGDGAGPAAYTWLSGTRVLDTLGGGVAFTDADTESGPAPDRGR